MDNQQLAELLPAIEQIALNAGGCIMEIYRRDFEVDFKADESPLTEADKAANTVIVKELQQLTPHIPILSEEAVEAFKGPNVNGLYWLVDPLDGTKEFIKRNGEFTVNIALIENGKPILGVVYAPVLETSYVAARGLGAFKIYRQMRASIQVNEEATLQAYLKVVGSRSHVSEEVQEWLGKLTNYEMVSMGSSLKLCLVAEGVADLYPRIGLTSLWDTAAAHAVVLQAGGVVADTEGNALSYSNPETVLNPYFLVGNIDLVSSLCS
ncbi:3'(2'),5'-bisphosphate nucleotidase [Marinomonas piezotolerans]|uniref:3'(2'),5'-bisphosphate nucleotidase CysQ n=1 Tax=Marinomonas piezotolerans TaxID=2213058 RepID=A0A370U8E0_9GAMM|nr:3'(2'),5'-bisphosphate nucleotidase CysQ [Marinomonas piezotolerans]RDL44032.1 3'(2'),5'-bisphosphate nucleotidase [Marinomonas piezotolerans]